MPSKRAYIHRSCPSCYSPPHNGGGGAAVLGYLLTRELEKTVLTIFVDIFEFFKYCAYGRIGVRKEFGIICMGLGLKSL